MTLKLAYAAPSRQLTDAPEIDSVRDLEQGWRKVCTMHGEGVREWHGQLTDDIQRRYYETLVVMDVVITVQYRVGVDHYRVFAKKKSGWRLPNPPAATTPARFVRSLMQNRSER